MFAGAKIVKEEDTSDTNRYKYSFQNNFRFKKFAKSLKLSQSERKEKPMKRPIVPPKSPTRDPKS